MSDREYILFPKNAFSGDTGYALLYKSPFAGAGPMSFDLALPATLFCLRCGVELKPGSGDFFVVRIEAIADPTPPCFSAEDLEKDHRAEIERLLARMRTLSEQEAMDQIYRRLTVYLCGPCYRQWIERPVG